MLTKIGKRLNKKKKQALRNQRSAAAKATTPPPAPKPSTVAAPTPGVASPTPGAASDVASAVNTPAQGSVGASIKKGIATTRSVIGKANTPAGKIGAGIVGLSGVSYAGKKLYDKYKG